MRRILFPDLTTFVCGAVVFACLLALAGLWLDARADLDRLQNDPATKRITHNCTFYEDGSVTCPARTLDVTTTTVAR